MLTYKQLNPGQQLTSQVTKDYINAVESSDLHTEVAKMVWPNMGWTEDQEQNRALAEQPYFGNFSYRDVCKRAGHGTNYGASANTVARHTKIKVAQATAISNVIFWWYRSSCFI
jgi:hypothetical protein